jgi:diadenosine tetraphosphatase ApaH/serine/threonine PP2A family protein phosphatase
MILGTDMRILVVSDIHANLTALDTVIQNAGDYDRVWCLRDIVSYGPEPNECINRSRAFDVLCLAGNHDLAAVGKLDLEEFSQDARDVIDWTRDRLTAESVDWLKTLPLTVVLAEYGITSVHGSPRDPIWEYVVRPAEAGRSLELIDTPIGLNGHTHVQITFRKPTYGLGIVREQPVVDAPVSLTLDRMLINPGSVGQPRDDDVRAAFAVIDLEAMTLTHRRVQYDIAATQKLMKQAKLPDRLIRRLRFGE